MKGKGVIITTYFSLNDALIQAYTLPYVEIIRDCIPKEYPVILVTVDKISNESEKKALQKEIKQLAAVGITVVSFTYYPFGIGLLRWIPGLLRLLITARSSSIGTIHAWCTPGGIFGYFLSIVTGKRLVLDSFEPHAEVMSETGTWKRKSLKFKVLFWLEKNMVRRSEIQICCTADMKDYSYRAYGKKLDHYFVKPAGVDLMKFNVGIKKDAVLEKKFGLEDKLVCVYAGKFGGLYLKQEIFDFLKMAYDRWGERFRALLLTNESEKNISTYCNKSGLPEHVILKAFVPHEEVARYIGLADFALAPYQPVPSRKYAAPIKVSEYWALGIPVVITSNIADDSRIIAERKYGSILKSLDSHGYQLALIEIENLLLSKEEHSLEKKIRSFAEEHRGYSTSAPIYQQIYG